MSDAWQLLREQEPPFNKPLWLACADGSMLQAQNINHKLLMPKTGYLIDRQKVTHWTLVPELPR